MFQKLMLRLLTSVCLATLLAPAIAMGAADGLLSAPPYSLVRISPDGKNVAAYFNGGKDNYRFLIIDTKTLKTSRNSVSDGKGGLGTISDLRWAGNEHLVILSDGGGNDKWLHTYELGAKSPERLGKEGKRSFVRAIAGTTRFLVAEQIEDKDSSTCRLLEYDVVSVEEPKEIYSCTSKTFECVADSKGNLKLVKRDNGNGSNTAWYFVKAGTGEQKKLTTLQQWNKVHGIVQSSTKAIVSGQINTALPSIYVFDLEKDEVVQTLADQPLYSIDTYGSTAFDPYSGSVVGLHLDAVERRSFWTDSDISKLQQQVDAELVGTTNRILSWSQDRQSLLLERFIPNYPTQYFHVDVASNKFSAVLLNGPPIKPTDVGATRLIEIPNRNGDKITAVLTLPPERNGEKLPLLIWLRNGLWSGLDRPEWHPEANYFAAEGFAVLRINYSGSQGLLGPLAADTKSNEGVSRTFADIEDASSALIQSGLVDPNKICIGGEGVGAWAAAYAPIATPNRYQVVLSLNGVYDLVEYREASKGNNEMNGGLNLDFANAGSSLSDADVLAFSVSQNLSNYPGEVYLTLGKWSPQPYKNHIQAFIKALKKARVTVKLQTDDWYGSQLSGTKRIEAFARAASLAKAAVK